MTDIVIGNGSDLEMGILMGKAQAMAPSLVRLRVAKDIQTTVQYHCMLWRGKAKIDVTVNIIMLLFIIHVNLCNL